MVPSSFMTSQMTPAGARPREPRQIHGRLGLSGAHQHSAFAGTEGENVAGAGEVGRAAGGVDGGEDGAGAVGRGDSGGDALARIDSLGEGGAEGRGIVRAHQREPQVVAAFGREGQADEAAAVGGHEIDDFGSDLLGGDGEIAFILAVFVVHHDENAAGANLFNGFGNGDEGHALIVTGRAPPNTRDHAFAGQFVAAALPGVTRRPCRDLPVQARRRRDRPQRLPRIRPGCTRDRKCR